MSHRNLPNAVVLLCVFAGSGCASSAEQQRFKSPQAAADSLVRALRANDAAQLERIFGPASAEIISSGDPVTDRNQADRFLAAYDRQHRLETEADGALTLVVGENDWPYPVPIVKNDGGYVFDAAVGKDEILNRRIGRNELYTQQSCLAVVDAQREYAQRRPMGGDLSEYAQKFFSDPDKKNGLYWPTDENETPSPLGVLVAEASQEGFTRRSAGQPPTPFHGYHYRLLMSQGPHAPGGPAEYLVNGHLIGGFGFVAYPTQYGNSGIMTFMTNHDGVLYQRDLGPDTRKIAQSMTSFDPGPEWTASNVPTAVTAEPLR
jgi:hypothetical protein